MSLLDGWGGLCVCMLRDQVRDLLCVPEHLARVEERLHKSFRAAAEVFQSTARDAANAPALATVTVLCERQLYGGDPGVDAWVPSVFGAEVLLPPGQSRDLDITPQHTVRNFRWFVSGHPDIVCEGFNVANVSALAAQGGTKFGDFQGTCRLGNRIRVRLERRGVAS